MKKIVLHGAGKTTIFNLITGVYKVTSGNVIFDKYSFGEALLFATLPKFLKNKTRYKKDEDKLRKETEELMEIMGLIDR